MTKINCEDCMKTYRPYRYGKALLRVLMYGFSNWWDFEDERVIEEQFRKHWRDPYVRRRIVNKTRTYRRDKSFVGDFNIYYQYLENERRENISATFLCFDCEKYYCKNCVRKHYGHFTFSKDDKYNISKWGRISVGMLDRLKAEGTRKRENMKLEQTRLCDVVDVRCEYDDVDLNYVLRELERQPDGSRDRYGLIGYNDDDDYQNITRIINHLDYLWVEGLHVFNDNKKWIAREDKSRCIKIFNVNDNKMTRRIKLSSRPWGITEIPSTDPSQSLIAVSFPPEKQIHIMNIHSTPAQVVSSISVDCECRDLAYCNNKLLCDCFLDRERRYSVHVMDMAGEIINTIDLNNLFCFKQDMSYPDGVSVHSESETIYVCHMRMSSCVIGLSLDGQVLHSVTFTDLEPRFIHVDKDQNVYVMSRQLPIYKLSADLRHRNKVIGEGIVKTPSIRAMRFHNDKFYLASFEGRVYIVQHE